MKKSQWDKLKRGDRIRHVDHPHHIHTVLAVNRQNGTVLMNLTAFSEVPDKWIQVDEEYQDIDEHGEPLKVIAEACLMCSGAGSMGKAVCPRCKGDGGEPKNFQEAVLELRVFYPTDDADFPQLILTGRTPLDPDQAIELLEQATAILRKQRPSQMPRHTVGSGMVN